MTGKSDVYRPEDIELRAQELWERLGVFRTPTDAKKPFYCLDMFPYPSGEGLHVGHVEGYTATDIYSRYLRMRGYDVLHPMGWDAFGLPAENTAIQQQAHPRALVEKNIARFRRQLGRLGFSYDWGREINTTNPYYYKWTQWIFLKLFHLGLAYEAVVPINWCPSCKTGLANEEVVGGTCERCGTKVAKKDLRQWLLRITKYADRLLRDLDALDWPEGIKELQRNWIGRSEGTEVVFQIPNSKFQIPVFTTRADTLFGATYIVLAPEHPLVAELLGNQELGMRNKEDVRRYVEEARSKSDLERTALEKEKTGVDTGAKAINPVNGEEIPIWVADYVLASYGTGAIMAVPAHDERDFEFAKKCGLPIRVVVIPTSEVENRSTSEVGRGPRATAFVEDGILVQSSQFSGLPSGEAREKITAWLAERNQGHATVNYKLRDWVFSRQRYWGEPIPIVHCSACGVVPVPQEQLPVLLPDVEHYEPTGTGESPLAAITEWVNATCPQCAGPAKRETNTMPQWAGSCWYFLRFCDPRNSDEPWSWEALERWLPVTLYVGGAEHAVLHLLYARFWMKALYDGGYVPTEEPFQKLRNQGTILGPDGQKMSKSRGNVVNPDEIVEKYGADTLRLYEMFLGPLEAGKPWNPRAVSGVSRFLQRVWRLGHGPWGRGHSERADQAPTPRPQGHVERALHRLIKKVTEDIENLKFNTAIAAMMEFVNLVEKQGTGNREQGTGGRGYAISMGDFRTFLVILSPFAPHLAEALWQQLGHGAGAMGQGTGHGPWGRGHSERADQAPTPRPQEPPSITQQQWPVYDPALLEEETVQIVVQVDGKVRDEITVPRDLPSAERQSLAEKSAKVQKHLAGKKIVRVVAVDGRLVNFVTK